MRWGPAPVSRAKASSSFAKTGLSISFDRYQTVSPLAGATKAVNGALENLTASFH
jgi:hypothetical protein